MLTRKQIKNRLIERADVNTESDGLREALAFLDELFKAHAKAVIREKERMQDGSSIGHEEKDEGMVKVGRSA